MPGSTPIYNLPYPLGNETADPRAAVQALAEAVEGAIPEIPAVPVISVNGETGAVSLSAADVGAETPTGAQDKADAAAAAGVAAAGAVQVALTEHLADYAQDTGVANAYQITLNPAPAAYEIGKIYKFKAANANTGASTFTIGALAATAIKKKATVVLETGDILAGQVVPVMYDGTNFQLIPMNPPTISDASTTVKGIVQLSTSTSSTSTTLAATPSAVKTACDLAVSATNTANAAGKVVSGSYSGDGTNGRIINLGFRPKLLILGSVTGGWDIVNDFNSYALFVGGSAGISQKGQYGFAVYFGSTGFTVNDLYGQNTSGTIYYYVAIG